MLDYVLGVDAELDLHAIWEFIARNDVGAADKWIGKLFKVFESFGRAPGIGHSREDLAPKRKTAGSEQSAHDRLFVRSY